MMNKLSKLLIFLVIISLLAGCFTACDVVNGLFGEKTPNVEVTPDDNNGTTDDNDENKEPTKEPEKQPEPEFIDYASQVKFDPDSGRLWAYATVVSYIDGDTTHFNVEKSVLDVDHVKARYLGINTPESTGVIEPWGKKASNYTKTQLMKATSIIIESDTATWNLDSTGSRYLLWVWYKTAEDAEYRNLNLEILQQGLAYGSGVSSCVYGDVALLALNQAKTLKLHVFSKKADPDFYYGGAIELSLKELKANCEKYEGQLVKFEAVVAKQVGPTIYVEEYDAENDMYFGMQIYAGYNYGRMEDFLIGNRVSIVGTLQYYENGGTFQVSNLQFDTLDPEWEGGCVVLSTGHAASYRELDVDTLLHGTIVLDTIKEVEGADGEMEEVLVEENFEYGELAHYSTATLRNLTVQSVYTTANGGDSDGALTITCKDENGLTIKIRTASKLIVVEDGKNVVITAADFPKGTVISVKGVIDSFSGEYQIKVFTFADITFE